MVLNDQKEKGELASQSEYLLFTSLVQNPSDETLNIIDQCNQYMNVQGVKAIMAADEDEFAAVREEAMEQLDAMNLPQATEEMKQLYDEAKAAAEEFSVN